MKMQELLMNIHNKDFNLERGLQVKNYLPIEVKKTIAQGIIYDCTTEEDGVVKVDSVQRYLSYVRYMITTHTNLEYTDEDYDTLCSTEYDETILLNAIMDCFGTDAKECSRILDLMTDDYMQEFTIESTVAKFLSRLGDSIGGFVDNIKEQISNFDLTSIIPDDVDKGLLSEFLNEYVK